MMMDSCKKIVAVLVCALAALPFARPASMAVQTVQNKDGSSVSIRHFGDEHYHYTETADGYLVTGADGYYVYVDASGKASSVVAKNAADRSADDIKFLEGLDQEAARKNHKELNGGRFPDAEKISGGLNFEHVPVMYSRDAKPARLARPKPPKWVTGERWIPVLLVGTTDKAHGDSAEFHAFLNQEGYSKDGNVGSLRDYYLYSSGGKFNPHFDVYPVNIDASLTSFGSGDRFSEGAFLSEGVKVLTRRADFLAKADKYCSEGKNVDGFIFLFPGMEEDALKQSSLFWGHAYQMSANGSVTDSFSMTYKSNGYVFDKYLFIAQYDDGGHNSRINMMGVFAHEFSHVLGLMDHYYKPSGGQTLFGPENYDIMSLGMYNGTSWNAGNIPAAFSAFEREAMGWLTLTEISKEDSVYGLKRLADMQAYSVTNPNQNDEYYIVEYRPSEKFDSKLGGGKYDDAVLVWYIDYDKTMYVGENAINKDPDHQRVTVKDIMNSGGYSKNFRFFNGGGKAKVPGVYNIRFAGKERACFTPKISHSIGECPEESSSSVESSNSAYSFVARSSSSMVSVIAAVAVDPRVSISVSGRTLDMFARVAGEKNVRLFDMQGNLVAAYRFAGESFSQDLSGLAFGAYIVRVDADKGLSERARVVMR